MSEVRSIHVGPLAAMWGLHPGGWFRLFGWGLSLSNHDHECPLFSERYNGQHGIPRRVYLHIGPWCVRVLKPRKRP